MNPGLHRLSVFSWPIWVKLLVGFLVAVLVPAVLIVTVFLGVIAEVTRANTIEHIEESGRRQREFISAEIAQAQASLNSFAAALEQSFVEDVVPARQGDAVAQAQFVRRLQDTVLNIGSEVFDRVELLDASGDLVLQAFVGRNSSLVGGESRVNTEAYAAGERAVLSNQPQITLVTAGRDAPVLEIVNLIQFVGENDTRLPVMGYLVATLNVERVLYTKLSVEDAAQTYVVSDNGVVITNTGLFQGDTSAFGRLPGVDRALSGREGVEDFDQDRALYLRYYGPITNTPLAFITEIPVTYLSDQVSNELLTRSFALILGLLFLVGVMVVLANQLISPPLGRVAAAIQAMGRGNFDAPLPDIRRQDEIGVLASSFADARERVEIIIDDLETRIAARVRDVEATQAISHYAATQRDLQHLMDQVVNLIVERFSNIYHAQIFLIDKEGQYAVLRASTGEPGRRLLELSLIHI